MSSFFALAISVAVFCFDSTEDELKGDNGNKNQKQSSSGKSRSFPAGNLNDARESLKMQRELTAMFKTQTNKAISFNYAVNFKRC